MTHWNIDSSHGTSLTEGLNPESYARKVAQRYANRLGESVYLYETRTMREDSSEETPDVELNAEEFKPE